MAERLNKQQKLPANLIKKYLGLCANLKRPHPEEAPRQEVRSAFSGEVIGWTYMGDEGDVERAFDLARTAQRSWAQSSPRDRARIFRDFHDRVLANRELLMDIVQLETGKNRASALDEVMDVAINARYYANQAPKLLAAQSRPGALPVVTQSELQRSPVGVVGQISPWNYPLALGISDAIPALLAGNGVVAKPDHNTPFSALSVLYLLYESGLPRDLMQVVTGDGPVVGGAISQRCDYLMFTGSTATGRILGRTAGERLIGYSAELGGKNPMIITADADIQHVIAEAPSACFSNSGQLCVSIERIYVEAGVYQRFLDGFVAAVKNMKLGPGFDWNIDMGSLINAAQLQRVEDFVSDAQEKGATVVCGGKARPDLGPYFYEPTVLVDVPDDARLKTEEVFGPVVFIEKVNNIAEAVEKANNTSYGLNACVFARPETGRSIASQLMAGGVGINDGYAAIWATVSSPLGGMKQSGMSRRHGPDGLLKYTEARNVAEQRWLSMRGPAGMPRKTYAKVMVSALKLGKKLHLLP
ncbi:aldehyde dehydrogenase family protein [Corynebacterium sp. 3HC-13]|uniref:succinic semialdehyde dehydrogenase n=1 Tax=Corynebacterium poyangense TaxID=2684405 RepID=UPI001CCBB62F|nr:succinic semialdehyde dehydrogenase [Corynebacterium poyangense]MBZ8176488.1 aldehyde dehydrogenase family protein [Corynebacterium poyangense]